MSLGSCCFCQAPGQVPAEGVGGDPTDSPGLSSGRRGVPALPTHRRPGGLPLSSTQEALIGNGCKEGPGLRGVGEAVAQRSLMAGHQRSLRRPQT